MKIINRAIEILKDMNEKVNNRHGNLHSLIEKCFADGI